MYRGRRNTPEDSDMEDRLWTPPKVAPVVPKPEGGSYFDDELEMTQHHEAEVNKMREDLIQHLNQRPDHAVYVSSIEERKMMREVFNDWKRMGIIAHNPDIKIEYGVEAGNIRLAP